MLKVMRMKKNRKIDGESKNVLEAIKENNRVMVESIAHLNETIKENNQDMCESIMHLSEAIKENGQIMVENIVHLNETVKENSRIVVESMIHTNKKLDDIRNDTDKIKINSASRYSTIIGIIQIFIAIISMLNLKIINIEPEDVLFNSEYQICCPRTVEIGEITDINVFSNFETDAISITAYLASGNVNTLELSRASAMEWKKKVIFDEVGVHEIIVVATGPNGERVESSIEVEVTPVSADSYSLYQPMSI